MRQKAEAGKGLDQTILFETLEPRTLLSVTPVVLATFTGPAGQPAPRVAVDAAGDVFGTTLSSGDSAGTVYEVVAGTGQVKTLATFGPSDPATNVDGIDPGDILIDAAGNLFGDADRGGATINIDGYASNGTLWELPAGASAVRVLYTFPPLGIFPASSSYGPTSLSMDSAGDLFGSAQEVIPHPYGTAPYAFEYVAAKGTTGSIYGVGGYVYLSANVASSPAGDAYMLEESPLFAPIGVSLIRVPASTTALPPVTLVTFPTPMNVPVGSPVPVGVAVDAAGDAFVTVTDGTITEVAAGSSSIDTLATLSTTDGSTFQGNPVLDGAGDLFAITSTGTLVELPAGATKPDVLMSSIGSAVTVDAAGNLFGTTPTATGVAVFELRGVGSPTPTLTPTAGASTVPGTVVAGTKVKGTVKVRLDNTGTTAIKGVKVVDLYAVTAGESATAGTLVGSAKRGGSLAGGRTATLAVAVKPVVLPAATYRLLAVVSDATGGTSTATTGPALLVAPRNVALSAAVKKVSTAATTPGKSLSFTMTVTNDGNVASAGATSVAIYLSIDGTARTVPVPNVRGVPKSPTIRSGRSVASRVTVKVPAGAAGTDLYLLVIFTQDGHSAVTASATKVAVG